MGQNMKASIGDCVWLDKNFNGRQDAGEKGIANVTVRLLDASGNVVATTKTDSTGHYLFNELNSGDYQLQFVKPNNKFHFTKQDVGENGKDSDANINGLTEMITLTAGEKDLSWAAGLYEKASIGDYVWLDKNFNGVQDAGEKGVANVNVKLLDATGNVVAATKTDSTGHYLFNELNPGDYQVQVVKPNNQFQFTKQDVGDNGKDSDVNSNGLTVKTTLMSGQNDLSWDAGLYKQTASIGDYVWLDKNFNGIQDAGDRGIENVTVNLLDANGKVVATTKTANTGHYLFDELNPGDYQLQFVKPNSKYHFTKQDVGENGKDSDANSKGLTVKTTLTAGENDLSWDAGLYKKASIGDRVWADFDGGASKGMQGGRETPLIGVKVDLLNATGNVVASTTSNHNGNYLFKHLDPGTYSLRFDKEGATYFSLNYNRMMDATNNAWVKKDVGTNDHIDSDAMVASGASNRSPVAFTEQTFLESGEDDRSWDAGITPIVIDLNGDGIHTISKENSQGAVFDLLGSGSEIESGWVSSDDGFLAIDSNGNGVIDDISELFGGINKGDGFAKLASFDSNGDGVVDASDDNFDSLSIWQDANSNHQTDVGELVGIADAGVESLSVEFTELPLIDSQGNLRLEHGSATLEGGAEVDMTDVYFSVSQDDAKAAGVDLLTYKEVFPEEFIDGPESFVIDPVWAA